MALASPRSLTHGRLFQKQTSQEKQLCAKHLGTLYGTTVALSTRSKRYHGPSLRHCRVPYLVDVYRIRLSKIRIISDVIRAINQTVCFCHKLHRKGDACCMRLWWQWRWTVEKSRDWGLAFLLKTILSTFDLLLLLLLFLLVLF